jgi:HD superfamily phosphodiesterase
MSFLTKLFNYVLLITRKYSIDESHSVAHSMNVLNYASNIYESESEKNPLLKKYENIIYISAILHDMCDKKYMDQNEGIKNIESFLKEEITEHDINVIKIIISTMSYSTVKKNGFPDLGPYLGAYHIVREADLLTAYDFDRCMIYHLQNSDPDMDIAFNNAYELFQNRVFKHNDDNLFLTEYSKKESLILHNNAIGRINTWKRLVNSPKLI